MTEIWLLATLWLGLALFATPLSIWFRIATALSEIIVGTVPQLIIGALVGTAILGTNEPWIKFLSGTGAIILTFLAGAELDPDVFKQKWKEATGVGLASFFAPFLGCTATVLPDTPVEEVMCLIDCSDIQRVCVVDKEGYFLGLISDKDLLIAFSERHPGIWDFFVSKILFTERSRRNKELTEDLRAKTAAKVMNTDIVTVREDTSIDEAIQLMIERAVKRLAVVDAEGRFKGMISRDSLLRAGFASS